MELVLNSEQSKLVDVIAVEKYGYNPIQLMEIASYNIFLNSIELIKKHNIRKIILLCGSGNNGGDGFAVAKHFSQLIDNTKLKKFSDIYLDEITIYHIGNLEKMTSETKTNYNIWKSIVKLNDKCKYFYINNIESKNGNENIDNLENIKIHPNTIIFECLVGVGVKSILNQTTSNLINKINHLTKFNNSSNIIKIAIDNPAGINVDNGNINQDEITKTFSSYLIADYTFSMFAYKTGMILKSGKKDNFFGDVKICDIGLYQNQFNKYINNYKQQIFSYKLNFADFRKFIPIRDNITSKFSFGKVVVFGGSREMSGAAVIAANTAITMGSGLVYLMTDTNGNDSKLYPEIIKNEINFNDLNTFSHSELVDFSEKIIDKYKNIDIWVIGPGLGNSTGILSLIEILVDKLLKNNKIVILDADGLRVININKSYNKNLILTPHIYEFTKLVKLDLEDVTKSLEENPIEFINDISKKLNCIIHLKYFPSITTLGNEAFLNDNYNSGLSKAGSGDMLSGLIAGLLAQTKFHTETKAQEKREVNTMQIVALASFIQTYLANLYTQKYNKESMRASDLIELIKEL